jgi:uncharacterized protein (TIGR00369 family)
MQNLSSFQPSDPNYRERVRASFSRQRFMQLLGAALVDLHPGYCEIQLAYRAELSQQHGYFHAGVIGTLADNAGGYAAYTLMPADASILTVEYKLNLLSPGDGDVLIARGYVVKAGRTLTVCRSDMVASKQGEERLCATALVTLMTLEGKPDGPLAS